VKARIPNILTIGRIILIPVFVFGILKLKSGDTAMLTKVFSLFLLMSFTDFLDGFLARKWNVTSDFGRMIDPIADKLFVAAGLIAIAISYNGDWIILAPAMAIIGRDILVSGAREHAALQSRAMPPTKLAKWKTACEMLAIGLFILSIGLPFFGNNMILEYGAITILWLAAILSVYTGSLYLRASLKD